MMRWIVFSLVAVLFVAAVPEKDRRVKWIQLFNGKNLNDWKPKIAGYPLGENYAGTFGVSDGKIKVSYSGYENFDERYGHLFYKQPFSYYLLAVEYRFTGEQVKGGPDWAFRNSGAMIHGQSPESMGVKQDFPISIEVQLLGGNGKDERSTANLCTPGTNVVMNGGLYTNHCINSTSKTFHGDQWVRVEVLVLGDSLVKHIVEGDTVLTYEKPQIGGGNVSNYDPKEMVDGKPLTKGYISLQSESHPVEFRKVELVDLEPYAHDRKKLAKALASLRHRN
ncbi:MAG TPA: DUF1080 domain-containing protein [Chryseolinea sp.]